jgi:hypothetical protein
LAELTPLPRLYSFFRTISCSMCRLSDRPATNLVVLFAQLPQLTQFVQRRATVLFLPHVKRRFTDPMLAADICHALATFGLVQRPQICSSLQAFFAIPRSSSLFQRTIPKPSADLSLAFRVLGQHAERRPKNKSHNIRSTALTYLMLRDCVRALSKEFARNEKIIVPSLTINEKGSGRSKKYQLLSRSGLDRRSYYDRANIAIQRTNHRSA